jgi:hypothetical protein
MSITHMLRRDPLPHLRAQVAQQTVDFVERFCRAMNRRTMRSREEAFLLALNEWTHYATVDHKMQMVRWEKELEKLSRPR